MSQRPQRLCAAWVEGLESRRLLSAASAGPLVGEGFEAIQWEGRTVYARPNQWIAAVDGLKGPAHKQMAAVNRALGAHSAGASRGLEAVQHLGGDGLVLVKASRHASHKQVRRQLSEAVGLDVAALSPDFAIWSQATANDPYYGQYGWALNNTGQSGGRVDADIDAPEAWNTTTGNGSVVVGVVDSGVDYTHPDLAANIWRNPGEVAGNGVDDDRNGYIDDINGWDFFSNDSNPMDDHGHGTHVAGTIAAAGNNAMGVAGVAWNAKVMALKFMGADGWGSLSGAVGAINYATKMRTTYGINVRVLNNSWGGGGYSPALLDAVRRSAEAGILFVAAAGNGGEDGVGDNNDAVIEYPGGYDVGNVLSVAATDHNDLLGGFSNYGAAEVDLAAPGVGILSTTAGGGYGYMSGTSMAAPHVSGVAALAWTYNPSASYQTVRSAIMNGVDKLGSLAGRMVSGGRLNAQKTLANLPASAPAMAPTAPTGLTATVTATAGQVALAWSDNSGNETGFKIERRTGPTGAWGQVAMVGAGVRSWQNSGLAAATVYEYRVLAYNAVGNSGYSNTASVKTRGVFTNLAQGRATAQSSVGWEGVSARAVDGSTDGVYWNNSVTHTNHEPQPWWQVDLGGSAWIDRLEIWNRLDGLSNRLQNFYVLVSDSPFTSTSLSATVAQAGVSAYHVADYPNPSKSIAIGRNGRYVRVQMAETQYLSLAEVRVFGEGSAAAVADQNLALGRATTQASTDWGGVSGRAVDGNTDGAYASGSVTHTGHHARPWWEVDLGSSANLTSVQVWNRLDGLESRLQDFYVLVSDAPFVSDDLVQAMGQPGVSSYHVGGIPNPSATVPVGRTGRYVRIQLAGTQYLSLAEVKVFGSLASGLSSDLAGGLSGSFSATDASAERPLASQFSTTAVAADRDEMDLDLFAST